MNNQSNNLQPSNNGQANSNLANAQQNAKINKDSDLYKRSKKITPRDDKRSRGLNSEKDKGNVSSKSSNNINNSNTGVNGKNNYNGKNNIKPTGDDVTGSNGYRRQNPNVGNNEKNGTNKLLKNSASTALSAFTGIPKPIVDKLVDGKSEQGAENRLKRKGFMSRLLDGFAKSAEGAKLKNNDNNENSNEQFNDTEESIKNVTLVVKKIVKIGATIAIFSMSWIFIILMIALLSADTIQKLIANNISTSPFGTTTEENKDTAADIDENGNNSGEIILSDDEESYIFSKDANVYLSYNTKFFDNSKKSEKTLLASKTAMDVDLSAIKEYYSLDCKKDNCEDTNIFKFYRKMFDIYFLYQTKYNVKLDLALINSTIVFNAVSQDNMFTDNINDYDADAVREDDYNNDNISNLDWEFDYKNMTGYKYLNSYDDRYDMQILAKNMVTKKISYSCGSEVKEAKNIETSNYNDKLKCENGTLDEDSITESYILDKKKYDEFLLEFLEHKNYLKGEESETDSNNVTTSDASKIVKVAVSQLNDSNKSKIGGEKYWKFMGFTTHQDWCAAFVSWCANKAGISTSIIPKTASTTVFLDFSKNQGTFHKYDSNYEPKAGDIVIWDASIKKSSIASYHVGIVRKYDKKTGKLTTIEGNTTGIKGGAVNENHYDSIDASGVAGFFSPKYEETIISSVSVKVGEAAKYKTQESKIKWLYDGKGVPQTESENDKYLENFDVEILNEDGKTTSKLNIRMHKKLKTEVQQIFKEMVAKGFIVHGGNISYRQWGSDGGYVAPFYYSAHTYGHAFDINPDENYYYSSSGATVGSHYSPGTDKYSVTQDIVNIWKKHGFYWGGDWTDPKDYMHFSYFDH